MNWTRRDVIKLGAVALCTGGHALAQEKPAQPQEKAVKKIPIGVQLYSVRTDCANDLPGTLAAIARMGYAGVEFAGYHGRTAAELRKMLDDLGLKCCGTHTGLDTLSAENLKATIEFNQALGNPYLIVPGLPAENTASVEAVTATARRFDELAEQLKPLGLHVGYHAHAGDFKQLDGQTIWDRIFSGTRPAVIMQLDTSNALDGGGDPVALLQKYPGRTLTIHLKEHGGKEGAVIGEGAVKWTEVFRLCESIGGTQWYIVEQERYATTPLESIRGCLDNLRKMGK
jgi:sugar phosphate isomerase/epimerase